MFSNRFSLLGLLVVILVLSRLLMGDSDTDRLVASVVVAMPFTYWWVIPYLNGSDMEMPTWGFSLEAKKNKSLRLALFVFGMFIYLACIFF